MLSIQPIKGTAYKIPIVLKKLDLSGIRRNPHVVAGDVKVEFFDAGDTFVQRTSQYFNIESNAGGDAQGSGTFADHIILADSDTNSPTIWLYLNANQMNHDFILVHFLDADTDTAGDHTNRSWSENTIIIPTVPAIGANIDTLISRLTSARAGYLDKLNVTGTLAHSDAAAAYKADVSGLSPDSMADAVWNEGLITHQVAGSAGKKLYDIINNTLTASQIQGELEENGLSVLDALQDDINDATSGLAALKTLLDTLQTTADAIKNFTAAKM